MSTKFDIFNQDFEQISFFRDDDSGLKAIVVIHDSSLGPCLGGLRYWEYETEEDALEDALRLAKGMTYKNAAACLLVALKPSCSRIQTTPRTRR